MHYLAFSFLPFGFGGNQPILVQETQSAKDFDMICPKMLPIKAATCLKEVPIPLDLPVDPFARFDFSRSSLSPEVASDEQQRGALPASTRSRWRQDALQSTPAAITTYCRLGWVWPFPFGRHVMCHLEHQGSRWIFLLQRKTESKPTFRKKLFDANNIVRLQEVRGNDEYLQAVEVLAPRFGIFGTFILENDKTQEDRLSAFIKDLLP